MKSADQHSFIICDTANGAGFRLGNRRLPLRRLFNFKLQIDPMHPVMAPVPLSPKPLEELGKAFLRSPVRQLQEARDDLAVAARSPPIPVYRSSQAHCRARAPFSQSMLAPQIANQFALD